MKEIFKRNSLLVVFLTIFVDMLGFGILIPVIPLLLANPSSEYFLLPHSFTISQGYIILGFLTASFPIMQFFATPILGELSDKFGRKPVLAISLTGTCISYLIFAFGILTRNIPLLFLSRGFDGITGGNVSVAQAAVADITEPKDRAKTFGLLGAAFGLGFILGPYIGGKLSDPSIYSGFSAVTPFLFAAGLSFINVLSVIFLFPETHKTKNAEKVIHWAQSIKNIIKAYGIKELRPIFATNFLFNAGFTFYTTFFSVFLINRFAFNQSNIGDFFSYVGLWVAITQGLITRKLSKHLDEVQVLRISLIGAGIVVGIYFIPNAAWQLLLVAPFLALFVGTTFANTNSLVSRSASPQMQGEILGINTSVQALAQSIPPILSGYIAASLTPESPIIVSSIVMIFSGVLFWVLYKNKKSTHYQAENVVVEPH